MLGPKDKTPTPWGGYYFHHTDPQRVMPCALGEMLVPKSADDIPPITEEAFASVEAALKLLADYLSDKHVLLYYPSREAAAEIMAIRRITKALRGILRIEPNNNAELLLRVRVASHE